MVNAHAADNAASIGSGSPPLLSILPSPKPLEIETPPQLGHVLLDSGAAINYVAEAPWMPTLFIGDLPTDDDNPMGKLNRAISTHLAELDRQRLAIGAKYDAFRDLLVKAQTNFDVSALKRRVRSAVGVHTALLLELISNPEAAIGVKYNEISALHAASKLSLTEALTIHDAPALNWRAHAAVDKALTAAMAPNGLLDQRIGKAVTSAVILAVDTIVDCKIQPRVQDTLDKIFVSYWDCVIKEQKMVKAEFAASLLANWSSAEADFKDEIHDTTSASIVTLDAALSSATTAFKKKKASMVKSIKKAHQNLSAPTLVPFMPPCTGLETMADNATPVGATRVA
jgi:hypothetical protein